MSQDVPLCIHVFKMGIMPRKIAILKHFTECKLNFFNYLRSKMDYYTWKKLQRFLHFIYTGGLTLPVVYNGWQLNYINISLKKYEAFKTQLQVREHTGTQENIAHRLTKTVWWGEGVNLKVLRSSAMLLTRPELNN